jgi:hypothetical protein
MPTLRKYKPSSPKSGYYIQANAGASHPITLQVTSLAETILEQTGYQPGGPVPTKLVWAMYDLGLLYTKSSLDPELFEGVSTEDIFREIDIGNQLSAAEKSKLVSYIEEYEGPQKDTLTRLKQELESGEVDLDSGLDTAEEDIPQTEDEAVSELYLMCSSVKEFRDLNRIIDKRFLLRSLQTFIPHPHADHLKSKVEKNGSIKYRLSDPDRDQTVWLKDSRGEITPSEGRDADYIMSVPCESGEAMAVISDGDVVEFEASPDGEYGVRELERDMEWVLPPSAVDMDEILATEYTHYDGFELEPIRAVRDSSKDQLKIVEVDRISQRQNPVIEPDGDPEILDQGKPGERYLAEKVNGNTWRVVSKVVD